MRHHWLFRSFATVLSVWLAICLAEPAQLYTCAMHGGLAIDVSMHDVGLHAEHGGAASIHSMAGHSHHDQAPDSQSKQCSCLGDCRTGKAPIFLAAAPAQLATVAVERSQVVISYALPSLVAPQFLLPFSNGPPDASSRA